MMHFSLYIFGAVYIRRSKLAPMVGLMQGKPFGWGLGPALTRVDCPKISQDTITVLTHIDCPKISQDIGHKLPKIPKN